MFPFLSRDAISVLISVVTMSILFGIYLYKEKSDMKEAFNSELEQVTALYDERFAKQEEYYAQLKQSMESRQGELSELEHVANSLRMQLSTSESKKPSLSSNSDRPDPAQELCHRRVRALEQALKEATNLIQERDQCAIDYNALYKQCKGGVNGG